MSRNLKTVKCVIPRNCVKLRFNLDQVRLWSILRTLLTYSFNRYVRTLPGHREPLRVTNQSMTGEIYVSYKNGYFNLFRTTTHEVAVFQKPYPNITNEHLTIYRCCCIWEELSTKWLYSAFKMGSLRGKAATSGVRKLKSLDQRDKWFWNFLDGQVQQTFFCICTCVASSSHLRYILLRRETCSRTLDSNMLHIKNWRAYHWNLRKTISSDSYSRCNSRTLLVILHRIYCILWLS